MATWHKSFGWLALSLTLALAACGSDQGAGSQQQPGDDAVDAVADDDAPDTAQPDVTGNQDVANQDTISGDANSDAADVADTADAVDAPDVADTGNDAADVQDAQDAQDAQDIADVAAAPDGEVVPDGDDASDGSDTEDIAQFADVPDSDDVADVDDVADELDVPDVQDIDDAADGDDVADIDETPDATDLVDVDDVVDIADVDDAVDIADVEDIADLVDSDDAMDSAELGDDAPDVCAASLTLQNHSGEMMVVTLPDGATLELATDTTLTVSVSTDLPLDLTGTGSQSGNIYWQGKGLKPSCGEMVTYDQPLAPKFYLYALGSGDFASPEGAVQLWTASQIDGVLGATAVQTLGLNGLAVGSGGPPQVAESVLAPAGDFLFATTQSGAMTDPISNANRGGIYSLAINPVTHVLSPPVLSTELPVPSKIAISRIQGALGPLGVGGQTLAVVNFQTYATASLPNHPLGVFGFAIDPLTGALTLNSDADTQNGVNIADPQYGTVYKSCCGPNQNGIGLAFGGDQQFLFSAWSGSYTNNNYAMPVTVAANGNVTFAFDPTNPNLFNPTDIKPGSATPWFPTAMISSFDGKYLWIVDGLPNPPMIRTLAVAANGVLTELSAIAATANPTQLLLAADGQHLYATSGAVDIYAIGPNGALTASAPVVTYLSVLYLTLCDGGKHAYALTNPMDYPPDPHHYLMHFTVGADGGLSQAEHVQILGGWPNTLHCAKAKP